MGVGPDGIPGSATAKAIDRCKLARHTPEVKHRGVAGINTMTRRRGHFHQTPCGTNHALATESRPVGQRLSWHEDRREAKNYPRRSLPSHQKRTQTEPATGHYPLARWKLLREKLGHFF